MTAHYEQSLPLVHFKHIYVCITPICAYASVQSHNTHTATSHRAVCWYWPRKLFFLLRPNPEYLTGGWSRLWHRVNVDTSKGMPIVNMLGELIFSSGIGSHTPCFSLDSASGELCSSWQFFLPLREHASEGSNSIVGLFFSYFFSVTDFFSFVRAS